MKTPPFKLKETIHTQSLAPLSELLNPEKRRTLKVEASLIDADTIRKIAQRGSDIAIAYGIGTDKFMLAMDITVVHLNIKRLKLLQLLMAGNDDFTHDVFGIARHLNRRDCVLMQDFKCKFFDES